MSPVQGIGDRRTSAFLNGDKKVLTEEEIQVLSGYLERFIQFKRLQHYEQIAVLRLHFCVLIAMPAILNVQRVKVVLQRERIKLWVVRIPYIVPAHFYRTSIQSP
jgi:hypothetical protein